jgi:hypothetical protein
MGWLSTEIRGKQTLSLTHSFTFTFTFTASFKLLFSSLNASPHRISEAPVYPMVVLILNKLSVDNKPEVREVRKVRKERREALSSLLVRGLGEKKVKSTDQGRDFPRLKPVSKPGSCSPCGESLHMHLNIK